MSLHSALTGADLHEPKGAAAASANTVYVANGSGSGAWSKVGSSQIDSATVLNVNKGFLPYVYLDVGTAGSQYIILPAACTITKISAVAEGAMATASTVLTFKNAGGSSMGTITFTSAAVAGDTGSVTPASNNTFTAGQALKIDTDGGTSTTPNVQIVLSYTLT